MSRIESIRRAAASIFAPALFIALCGAASAASLGPLDTGDTLPAPDPAQASSAASGDTGSLFDEPIFSSAPISDRVIGSVGGGDDLDLSPLIGKPVATRN